MDESNDDKILQVFEADHPHWEGLVYLYANGRMCRPGVDAGDYEWLENDHIYLNWDDWGAEKLKWCDSHYNYRSVDGSFTLKPLEVDVLQNKSKIIIGVLSTINPSYQNRRERCLATWLPVLESAGIEVIFLVGIGTNSEFAEPILVETGDHGRIGTELQIPCADDYDSLPQKTAVFCQWALKNREFNHLFKCDDDTYIVPRRLIKYDLTGIQYLGYEWETGESKIGSTGERVTFSYASGGAGYFLDKEAAKVIADAMEETSGIEDMLVGEYLHRAGIQLLAEPNLVAYSSSSHRPNPSNNHITGHAYDEQWHVHHQTWKGCWEDYLG